jgi:mannosyltransferase OCH1-like enzyme
MSWKTKDVVHSQDELIQKGLHNLIALNPEWQLDISTDEEVDAYLQTVLGSDYALVKDVGIVPQTDLWRLFKLYTEGGLYIDIDRLCNISVCPTW